MAVSHILLIASSSLSLGAYRAMPCSGGSCSGAHIGTRFDIIRGSPMTNDQQSAGEFCEDTPREKVGKGH